MKSKQLEDLLDYVKKDGRICPEPSKWHKLWEMLPDKRRVGSSWNPPLPLILAAWDYTSGLEKILRLKQHLEYAAEKGVLDQVEMFIKNLAQDEWFTGNN